MTVTEVFANFPATTVPAGASGTVVSGQADTWVVTSATGFPAAATGVTQFHVADTAQAASAELITVTNMAGTPATTWSVIRGAESTAPVAHGAGFAITQVLTAGWLGGVVSGVAAVDDGGTGGTSATVYALLTGGTSATAPFQQVGSVGGSVTVGGELLHPGEFALLPAALGDYTLTPRETPATILRTTLP